MSDSWKDKNREELISALNQANDKIAELESGIAETICRETSYFSEETMQSIPVFFVAIDSEGKIIHMNRHMLQSLGYEESEVVGKDYTENFVPEHARAGLYQTFSKLIEDRVHTVNENPILTKNGDEILMEWHGRPVFDEDGKFSHFYGIGLDITKRKEAEKEQDKSKRRYRQLYESMMDAYVMVAMDGRILEFNQSYLDMLQYSAEEIRELSFYDLTPSKWHEYEKEIIEKQVLVRGYSDVYEKEYIRKNGEVFPIELTAVRIQDDDGGNVGIWGIVRDISRRVETTRKLKQSKDELEINFNKLRIINQLSERLHRSLDFSEIAEEVGEIFKDFSSSPITGLYMLSDDGRDLEILETKEHILASYSDEIHVWASRLPISESINGIAVTKKEIVQVDEILENLKTPARTKSAMEKYRFKSVVCIPLLFENEVLGTISLAFKDEAPKGIDHEFLMLIGKTVTLALINAKHISRLKDEVRRRKAKQEALRKSEQWLSTTLKSVGDAVIATDIDGKITMMNAAAQKLTGYTMSEAVGRRVSEVFHVVDERNGVQVANPAVQALLEKRTIDFEQYRVLISKDGIKLPISDNAAPIMDDEGEVLGSVLVFRDMSDAREKEAQQRHQQKLQAIGTLAGGVAHEINNPVNIIMNFAQLIRDEVSPDSQIAQDATEIEKESVRIAGIVRNLLSFSRQEKETHSPARIKDIVDSTISLTRKVLKTNQISIEADIPDDLPRIKCRSQQIMQVLMNLITNARDALNQRFKGYDERKLIRVIANPVQQDDRRWIRISVEDSGVGIPAEIQAHIFDPFFTSKNRNEGTGLGLSVSYGIVQEHHGILDFESIPGQGTKFFLLLPVDNGWEV